MLTRADFEDLYDKHAEAIYRFLYWQSSEQVLAQDLTSSTFERAWRARKSFKGGSAKAWLYKIARNLLTDHWRKRKSLLLDDVPGLADRLEAPDQVPDIDLDLAIAKVSKKLSGLPDNLRTVIVLRFIEELSAREVGEIIGQSEGNVRVMQYRALKRLKEEMENEA